MSLIQYQCRSPGVRWIHPDWQTSPVGVTTGAVTPVTQVAARPAKPLMVFDGDCNFCRRWIGRWQQATGDRVEYLPFQDPLIAGQFPELPREQFEQSVQLIETDGRVFRGAEAVFRSLTYAGSRWPLWLYQKAPGFASLSEWAYHVVAQHRYLFSALTKLFLGTDLRRPSYLLARWLFLRLLGIIYLTAFVSLWTQIGGLVGSQGITPASQMMRSAREQVTQQHIGLDRYRLLPTLCWFSASDESLKFQCAAGAILSGLLIFGLAPAPVLFLLWILYLSLTSVCDVFLGFQWDNLLLETGLLAVFVAPLQMLPRLSREREPSSIGIWLLRWLLFRLMFESGCVKLLRGDPTWDLRHLTALNYHYETQPLPTWIGWHAHQLPAWFQKISVVTMFGIEVVVPFLIFAPRRLRIIGAGAMIALQLLIAATGNYCFFNLLTVALCVLLLDDAAVLKLVPPRWQRRCGPEAAAAATPSGRLRISFHWTTLIMAAVVAVISLITTLQLSRMFGFTIPWSRPALGLHRWLAPLRSVNNYGLFSVMTTSRPEIIVEGSNDGQSWLAYEFKYKPGDLKRRPRFVAPHQPRLDWQMWFAALSDYQNNPWFINFCVRLLQGSPEALALLERNPFPNAPPRYVRAVVYEYHFTDFSARRADGAWWRREFKGAYCPVLSLPAKK